jgi:hypothetical protein
MKLKAYVIYEMQAYLVEPEHTQAVMSTMKEDWEKVVAEDKARDVLREVILKTKEYLQKRHPEHASIDMLSHPI